MMGRGRQNCWVEYESVGRGEGALEMEDALVGLGFGRPLE